MEKEGSLPHIRAHEEGFDTIKQRCRGFGHIELQPNNDTALSRCLSTYNHCKWRGGVLRLEVAKQGHAHRHAAEVAKETAEAQEKTTAGLALKAEREASMFDAHKEDLRVAVVSGIRRCKVWDIPAILPKRSKLAFPACSALPLDSMEWALPETDSSIYIRNTLQYLPSQAYIPTITPEGSNLSADGQIASTKVAAPVVAPVVPKVLSHENYGMLKIFKAIDNVNQKLARSTMGDTVAARAKARAAPQKAKAAAAAASISDALGPQAPEEETVDFMEGSETAAFAARTSAAAVAATAPRLRPMGMPVGGVTTRVASVRAQAKPSGAAAGASGMDRFDDDSSDDEGCRADASPQASEDESEEMELPVESPTTRVAPTQKSKAAAAKPVRQAAGVSATDAGGGGMDRFDDGSLDDEGPTAAASPEASSGEDDDMPSPSHTPSHQDGESFSGNVSESVSDAVSDDINDDVSDDIEEETAPPAKRIKASSPQISPAAALLKLSKKIEQTQQAQTIARLTAAAATAAAAAASAAARLEEAQSAVVAAQEAAALAVAAVTSSHAAAADSESLSASESDNEDVEDVEMSPPPPSKPSQSTKQVSPTRSITAKVVVEIDPTASTKASLKPSQAKQLTPTTVQPTPQPATSSPVQILPKRAAPASAVTLQVLAKSKAPVRSLPSESADRDISVSPRANTVIPAADAAAARVVQPQVPRRSQPVGAPVQIWIPSRPAAHTSSGGGGSRKEQMLQRFDSDSDEDICDVESEDEGRAKASVSKPPGSKHGKHTIHTPAQLLHTSTMQDRQAAANLESQRGKVHQAGGSEQIVAAVSHSHLTPDVVAEAARHGDDSSNSPHSEAHRKASASVPQHASTATPIVNARSSSVRKHTTVNAPTSPLSSLELTAVDQVTVPEALSPLISMPHAAAQAVEQAEQPEMTEVPVTLQSHVTSIRPVGADQVVGVSVSTPLPFSSPPHQAAQPAVKTQALPFRFGFFGAAAAQSQPFTASPAHHSAGVLVGGPTIAAIAITASVPKAQTPKQQPAATPGRQQQQRQPSVASPLLNAASPAPIGFTPPQRPGFSRLTAGASFFRTGITANQSSSLPSTGQPSALGAETGTVQGQSTSTIPVQDGPVSSQGGEMSDAVVGSEAWQAQRVLLTADWKSKHRAAVRKSAKQKPKSAGQGGAKRRQSS